MGSTCHLKALVTAGTRLGVTKVGLGFLIPIPSHCNFFFFFKFSPRLNRDTKAAGVGFVGKVRIAAEPHPVPSVTSRCCCLKWLDLGYFYGHFSLSPRAGLTLSQGKTFPGGGIQRAARSQPRTGAEFCRRIRFSSSILPWGAKGGPAPAAVRAGTLAGSFMPVKYYPGAGEVLEAWDQGQGVLSPHIPPSHPVNFPACSLPPGMLNLRCKFPGKSKYWRCKNCGFPKRSLSQSNWRVVSMYPLGWIEVKPHGTRAVNLWMCQVYFGTVWLQWEGGSL